MKCAFIRIKTIDEEKRPFKKAKRNTVSYSHMEIEKEYSFLLVDMTVSKINKGKAICAFYRHVGRELSALGVRYLWFDDIVGDSRFFREIFLEEYKFVKPIGKKLIHAMQYELFMHKSAHNHIDLKSTQICMYTNVFDNHMKQLTCKIIKEVKYLAVITAYTHLAEDFCNEMYADYGISISLIHEGDAHEKQINTILFLNPPIKELTCENEIYAFSATNMHTGATLIFEYDKLFGLMQGFIDRLTQSEVEFFLYAAVAKKNMVDTIESPVYSGFNLIGII